MTLPDRILSQLETETSWFRDRSNLLECGDRFKILTEFYSKRDAKLRGDD